MIPFLSAAFAEPPLDAEDALASLRVALSADALRGLQIQSEITRIDWGQSPAIGEPLVISRGSELRSMGDDGDQLLEISQRIDYPYVFPLSWTERIDRGLAGEIRGADTFRGDRHRLVSSARLGFREKQRLLAVPAWLVGEISPESSRLDPDGLVIEGSWDWGPVELVLDPNATTLLEVRYVEDLPPLGDVPVVVRYGDWRGAPAIPWRVEVEVDGHPARVEVRTRVEALSELSVERPSRAAPHVPELAALGGARAVWFDEWLGFGFPQDDAPTDFPLRWREVSPGIHLATGGFHNVVVVDLGGGELTMLDAPLSPELIDSVFEELSARWPGARVASVVATHHHLDHIGGIRAIAARGIPIVIPAADQAWFRELLARPASDNGRGPVPEPRLIPVGERHLLTGSEREIELLAIPNPHADDMQIAWVPSAELIHVADLLNPGLFPTRGPYGWLARRIIAGIDPFDLAKAGSYAASLDQALQGAGLAPERIIGGHGPQVARRHALRVLSRYADLPMVEEKLAGDRWVIAERP